MVRYSVGFRADGRLFRIITEGADSQRRTVSGFLRNLVLEWDAGRRDPAPTARRLRPPRKPATAEHLAA
jgi:hypothetical protein